MTEKRNSRIALLAVAMLLSGALLGLMSEDSSAADNNAVGFISSADPSGVDVTIINQATGESSSTTSADDGSYSFTDWLVYSQVTDSISCCQKVKQCAGISYSRSFLQLKGNKSKPF